MNPDRSPRTRNRSYDHARDADYSRPVRPFPPPVYISTYTTTPSMSTSRSASTSILPRPSSPPPRMHNTLTTVLDVRLATPAEANSYGSPPLALVHHSRSYSPPSASTAFPSTPSVSRMQLLPHSYPHTTTDQQQIQQQQLQQPSCPFPQSFSQTRAHTYPHPHSYLRPHRYETQNQQHHPYYSSLYPPDESYSSPQLPSAARGPQSWKMSEYHRASSPQPPHPKHLETHEPGLLQGIKRSFAQDTGNGPDDYTSTTSQDAGLSASHRRRSYPVPSNSAMWQQDRIRPWPLAGSTETPAGALHAPPLSPRSAENSSSNTSSSRARPQSIPISFLLRSGSPSPSTTRETSTSVLSNNAPHITSSHAMVAQPQRVFSHGSPLTPAAHSLYHSAQQQQQQQHPSRSSLPLPFVTFISPSFPSGPTSSSPSSSFSSDTALPRSHTTQNHDNFNSLISPGDGQQQSEYLSGPAAQFSVRIVENDNSSRRHEVEQPVEGEMEEEKGEEPYETVRIATPESKRVRQKMQQQQQLLHDDHPQRHPALVSTAARTSLSCVGQNGFERDYDDGREEAPPAIKEEQQEQEAKEWVKDSESEGEEKGQSEYGDHHLIEDDSGDNGEGSSTGRIAQGRSASPSKTMAMASRGQKLTKTGKIQHKWKKAGVNKRSTAYNRFLQQQSKLLALQLPDLSPQERMKRIAEAWATSEKNPHKSRRRSRYLDAAMAKANAVSPTDANFTAVRSPSSTPACVSDTSTPSSSSSTATNTALSAQHPGISITTTHLQTNPSARHPQPPSMERTARRTRSFTSATLAASSGKSTDVNITEPIYKPSRLPSPSKEE